MIGIGIGMDGMEKGTWKEEPGVWELGRWYIPYGMAGRTGNGVCNIHYSLIETST